MKNILLVTLTFISLNIKAQTKILFDATKAEMAGNADWVIDADTHNLGFSTGPAVVGGGTESSPQKTPTPLQSLITGSTSETYWNGALSNWAIDCVKKGYTVESLPYNGLITYGVGSNLQDLSNYKVFVVDEPNILFTASEKTAIMNFVKNGGGLCMISDHDVSDRNNDTYDSPHIWDDLITNNSVQNNAFGIVFDYVNISETSSNIASLSTNPILHGTAGDVTQVKWSNGTTMTLNTTQNNSATGLIYKTGSSTTGTTNVMCASAIYQSGKVITIGDSSVPDDGTGDSGDTLYNGYTLDAAGNHQRLLMNAIIWLVAPVLSNENFVVSDLNFTIAPNPIQDKNLKFNFVNSDNEPFQIIVFDALGRTIQTNSFSNNDSSLSSIFINDLNSGIYFCKISTATKSKTLRFVVQ